MEVIKRQQKEAQIASSYLPISIRHTNFLVSGCIRLRRWLSPGRAAVTSTQLEAAFSLRMNYCSSSLDVELV